MRVALLLAAAATTVQSVPDWLTVVPVDPSVVNSTRDFIIVDSFGREVRAAIRLPSTLSGHRYTGTSCAPALNSHRPHPPLPFHRHRYTCAAPTLRTRSETYPLRWASSEA